MIYRLLLLALLAFAALPAAPAEAQLQKPQRPFGIMLAEWTASLDRIELELKQPELTESQLEKLEERINRILPEAKRAMDDARARLEPLRRQYEALGPPPAPGEPPETAEVAARRAKLSEDISFYEARVKQAEVTIARAVSLFEDLNRTRRLYFTARLFERNPSPLAPSVWPRAAAEAAAVLAKLAAAPAAWWDSDTRRQAGILPVVWIALAAALTFLVFGPLRLWITRRYGRDPALADPPYGRRVLAAGVEAAARAVVPALTLWLLAVAVLDLLGATEAVRGLVEGAAAGVGVFVVAAGLADAAFSPRLPAWRIVPVVEPATRVIARRLTVLAAVLAAAAFLRQATAAFQPFSPELSSVASLAVDTPIAILLLALLPHRLWRRERPAAAPAPEKPEEAREAPARKGGPGAALRVLLGAALVAIPAAALAGYGNLADRMTQAILFSGALIGALLLIRQIVRELLRLFIAPEGARSEPLRKALALGDGGARLLLFWTGVFVDLGLIVAGVFLALLAWGMPPTTMRFLAINALQGIRIGNLTISLTDIALAIVVFAVAMAATRMLQRGLAEKFLPHTRLHPGVQHSLAAAAGYVGMIVAAMLAVSTLGLDLSNLALIAGALTVGIGFGLQNVVNNFVSGLILLVERPIKVGDWVAVGGQEGYVKRINVRATELQTFQRASVIIPNSEILSSAVLNWTHKDKYGRVEVGVGVAYGTDTERVREILLDVARAHPQVLGWPEPYVIFRDFGASSLDFELRAYLVDVENRLSVGSDLRFAIDRAFREAGIEIPFPQRDLHLKDIARIERALRGEAPAGDEPADRAPGTEPAPTPADRRRPARRGRPPRAEADFDGDDGD